jgi:hypothetical protein
MIHKGVISQAGWSTGGSATNKDVNRTESTGVTGRV